MSWIIFVLVFWLAAWWVNIRLSRMARSRVTGFAVPALFGITLLLLWEGIVRGFGINPVLLPAPSAIGSAFASSLPILWTDFVQTFVKGALSGYVIGCGAAFLTAVAIDRWKADAVVAAPEKRSPSNARMAGSLSSERLRSR